MGLFQEYHHTTEGALHNEKNVWLPEEFDNLMNANSADALRMWCAHGELDTKLDYVVPSVNALFRKGPFLILDDDAVKSLSFKEVSKTFKEWLDDETRGSRCRAAGRDPPVTFRQRLQVK